MRFGGYNWSDQSLKTYLNDRIVIIVKTNPTNDIAQPM